MLGRSLQAGRVNSLDGLRGLAAAAVIYYHAILHGSPHLINDVLPAPLQAMTTLRDVLSKAALALFNGEVAVHIFFVLSGLVLSRSLSRRAGTPVPTLIAQFTATRLLRLYPAVIVCMAAFYAISLAFSAAGIAGFPVFGLQSFLHNASLYKIAMHGPSLTLQIEVVVIPFLLVAFFVSRKFALPGAILCFVYSLYALDGGWRVLFLPHLHGYLLSIIAGVVIADDRLKPAFAATPSAFWWLALAVLLGGRATNVNYSIPALIAMSITAAVLVGGLYHGNAGSLGRLLNTRPAQFLGRISYSLYLLNVIVLYALWAATDRWSWVNEHNLEVGLVVGTLALLISIPFSVAMERWVEQPGIRLGRRLSEAIGATPQAVGRPDPEPQSGRPIRVPAHTQA